jgi:carbon-monoxide dehydrogenase medium subunit
MSSNGARRIAAGTFFQSPLTTTLAEDEIITALSLPPWPAERRWGFQEFSRQRGGFPLAGVAVYYDERDGTACNAHLAVIAAHSRLERLNAAEQALNGHALTDDVIETVAQAAAAAIDPVSDTDGPPDYRRALVKTLTVRALEDSVARKAIQR